MASQKSQYQGTSALGCAVSNPATPMDCHSDANDNPYQYVNACEREHQKRAMLTLRKAMKQLDQAFKASADARVYSAQHKVLLPEYHAATLLHDALEFIVYRVRHDINRYLQVARPEPEQPSVPQSQANYI